MIPNNALEAIEKLKNVDRFDPWHIESNEFTEDDHIAIQEVISWLEGFFHVRAHALELENSKEKPDLQNIFKMLYGEPDEKQSSRNMHDKNRKIAKG